MPLTRAVAAHPPDLAATFKQNPKPSCDTAADEACVTKRRRPDPSAATAAPFKLGQRVRHASFGEGVVLSYEGAGAHTLIEVNFAGAGRKRLVLAYANLAPL